MIKRAFEEGWGGAIIKTLAYDIKQTQNVSPRIHSVKQDGRIAGLSNIELGSMIPIDIWLKDIVRLKKDFPRNVIFASLLHTEGLVESQWIEVAKKFQDAGVDGLELNLSCSHGMAESGGGAIIGRDIDLIRRLLGSLRKETYLPIMVKLPAIVENLPHKAVVAQESGANSISAINSIRSLGEIDIYNFVPFPQVNGRSAYSGLSGPAIKHIGLGCVAQIAREVKIPISGIGGITSWEDAVQYLLVGASTVQVCSAVMQYGYRIIRDLKQGLQDYLEKMGFDKIEDLVGLALPNIKRHNELSRAYRVVARVHSDYCIGCGLCFMGCNDSGYQAITILDTRIPFIDEEKCDGCGLCTQICPIANCIELKPKSEK
jgi:dihydropyrimidine dehydrogenase (NAD+) subunit PreA